MSKDREARRAVLALLAKGLVTIPEAAALAGVSRQLVRYWARGLRWQTIRQQRIADAWRKEMRRGPKFIETGGNDDHKPPAAITRPIPHA